MRYKISFVFAKKGLMKYVSHLDLMRLLVRAMRRAGLPLEFSCGFSPHPRLSLKRALKLGVESENEEGVIYLSKIISPEDFRERLQAKLPEGVYLKEAKAINL